MLHIACRADIPPDSIWSRARRRPTLQPFVRTQERGSVATDYGALVWRADDVLIEGVTGVWHPLTPPDLNAAYIEEPENGKPDDVLVFDAGGRLITRLSGTEWNSLVQRRD